MAPAEGAPLTTDAPTAPSPTSSITAGASRATVGGVDDGAGGDGIEAETASEAGTATSATALAESAMAGGGARVGTGSGTAAVGLDDTTEAVAEIPLSAPRGVAVVTPREATVFLPETAPPLGSSSFGNGTGWLFWVPSPPSSNGVGTDGEFPTTTFVPVTSTRGGFCAFTASVAATATGRPWTGGATLGAAGGQTADGDRWMAPPKVAPPATDAPVTPAAAPRAPGGNDDGAGGDGIKAEMALGAGTAAPKGALAGGGARAVAAAGTATVGAADMTGA